MLGQLTPDVKKKTSIPPVQI